MQRHAALDRGDVDDHAGALGQHGGQQGSVEPDGGEQIGVESGLPILVRKRGMTAARCRRAANVVDEDIDPAEPPEDPGGERRRPVRRAQVGRVEQRVLGPRPGK